MLEKITVEKGRGETKQLYPSSSHLEITTRTIFLRFLLVYFNGFFLMGLF